MKMFRFRWTTGALVSIAIVAAAGTRASGQGVRIVAPSSTAGVEADDSISPSPEPNKIQMLFPASDFAGLPASKRLLVAFNFRGDQTQTQAVDWNFPDEEFWISTTDKTSATLSTVFADNHGPEKTLVHDGSYVFRILGSGPPQGPRDFADGMRFQRPFYYDPSKGNLLIEQINYGGSMPNISPTIDVRSTQEFTLLGGDFNPNGTTGTLFTGLPVMLFEFVPEPSTVVLAGLALVSLFAWRRN